MKKKPIIHTFILFFLMSMSASIFAQQMDTIMTWKKPEGDITVRSSDTTKQDSTKRPKSATVRIGYEIVDGDTLPVYLYKDYIVERNMSPEEQFRYKKLVRDLKVALPYAKLAAFRLQMMEDNLSVLKKESARKKYIKECEKAIKKEFMDDLKDLTITQGKLLLKLIHRETGKTTWEILNSYQGKLETIFWQSMASMYGATTKDPYDPVVDYEIEQIIRKLELE
jgi:hypothetical protein